jgi:hypothetical protein
MKKLIFTVALMAITGMAFAQKELVESKSLVGIWQQAQANQSNDGQLKVINLPTYKVIKEDMTYYSFSINNLNNINSNVVHWGTYKITSDSTFTESVIKHYAFPALDNSESIMRFKLLDDNMLVMKYYNNVNKEWVPEVWKRVTPRKLVNITF